MLFICLASPDTNIKGYHGVAFAESTWRGIPPGSEDNTSYLYSNQYILANNIDLKWVDVDPNTCNMDLDDLERKISNKTRAIMVVHWGGYPIDLDRLRDIQERAMEKYGHKPVIIED